MRVEVEVEDSFVECGGVAVRGTCATCSECDHYVEMPLTEEAGLKAVLAKLRRTCPNQEQNTYVPIPN